MLTAPFVTVDVMIRDQGVETLRGHPREAVFDAAMIKANWPTAAGIRIGPVEDVLVANGRVRAELHLPGLLLSVTGEVTKFEPGARIEAAGTQSGIFATMMVRLTDNANDHDSAEDEDPNRSVETTLTWRFEARLPHWLVMFELPAAAAIKAAIPVLRARFIANIVRDLDGRRPANDGPRPPARQPKAAGTDTARNPLKGGHLGGAAAQ
jgi:hypothetical protein